MSGLKQKEQEIGLVDLNKHASEKSGKHTKETQGNEKQPKKYVWTALAGVLAGSLLMILLGLFLCKVSLISVCFVIVIEAAIASLLNDSELWIHIGVMVIEVVIGIVFGHLLFLILAAAYYFLLLVVLKLFELEG